MSLSVSSRIAYSALSAAQVQINVASSNIANADTEGYTVKTATQVATTTQGVGTGTSITAITSTVDKYVLASLVAADSDLGAAETTSSYTDQLQSLMGSTTGSEDGGTSIASSISELETALSDLATSPDSDTMKAEVIDALDAVSDQLRETSSSIQSLRHDADSEIGDSVETVNDALNTISDLNDAIVAAKAVGQSTADLEDERTAALQTVASAMDIKYTTTSTGALYVYTGDGTALVNSSVHELSYAPASTVTGDTVFGAITVDGKDVTDEIDSGSIGALLTLRDETLVDAQDELDALATSLIDTLNTITADGTSVPAPISVSGTTHVVADDSLDASGSVRIALVDEDGTLASYADLDLSQYATVGDLVGALDAIDGIDASIADDGTLTITSSDSSLGISIGSLDSVVGEGDESFSSYFGLNAVLTGTSAANIRVSSDLLEDSSLLATGSLSDDATLTAGETVLTSGSTTIADALLSAMSDEQSYAATGGLGAQSASFADYAAAIVADVADTASDAETNLSTQETLQATLSDTISSQSGVNLDEETAKLSDYEALYSAAAQIISTLNEMFEALLDTVSSAG